MFDFFNSKPMKDFMKSTQPVCRYTSLFSQSLPCHFEPRYDILPAEIPSGYDLINASPEALEKFQDKTYVCDICTTCGMQITRR